MYCAYQFAGMPASHISTFRNTDLTKFAPEPSKGIFGSPSGCLTLIEEILAKLFPGARPSVGFCRRVKFPVTPTQLRRLERNYGPKGFTSAMKYSVSPKQLVGTPRCCL